MVISPLISHIICERRIRYAGYSYRSDKEIVRKSILCNQNHGKTKVGRPHKTFLDQLKNDVDMDIGDMKNAMKDRYVWKIMLTIARAIRSTQ